MFHLDDVLHGIFLSFLNFDVVGAFEDVLQILKSLFYEGRHVTAASNVLNSESDSFVFLFLFRDVVELEFDECIFFLGFFLFLNFINDIKSEHIDKNPFREMVLLFDKKFFFEDFELEFGFIGRFFVVGSVVIARDGNGEKDVFLLVSVGGFALLAFHEEGDEK